MKISLMTILAITFAACSPSENKRLSESRTPLEQQPAKPRIMSPEDSAKYLQLGDDLVTTSKQVISAALVGAMEKGGVKYAATFCNAAAYPIVDSLSKAHHARIRRVSDKPRNPKDAMDAEEQKVFAAFKEKLKQPNAEATPVVIQSNDSTVSYYSPIKISMPTCLNCHGEVGKEVKLEDYAVMKSLYPNDNAVGYKQGDLRGMFSVRFIAARAQTR